MSTSTEQRVKTIIADQLGHSIEGVVNDGTFEALGADSLDQIELVMALEDEFAVQIDDDQAERIQTVQQAIDYITRLLPAAGAA